MFDDLYQQYKKVAMKKRYLFFVILVIVLIVLGVVAFFCLHNQKYVLAGVVIVGMILAGIIYILFIYIKPERESASENPDCPVNHKRTRIVIGLLLDFQIDINDEKQLDNLIKRAQKEQTEYDSWKGLKKTLSEIKKYVVIPIITVFVSVLFKGDVVILLQKTILVVFISCFFAFFYALVVMSFSDLFCPDIRRLGIFIRDIEDIMTFPKKAQEILEEINYEKENSSIIDNSDDTRSNSNT